MSKKTKCESDKLTKTTEYVRKQPLYVMGNIKPVAIAKQSSVKSTVDPKVYAYSTFSGDDTTVSIDGTVAIEAQSISYAQTWDQEQEIWVGVGTITFIVFTDDPVVKYFGDSGKTNHFIYISMANEYGKCACMELHGVKITSRGWGTGVEELVTEMHTNFTFKKLIPLREVFCSEGGKKKKDETVRDRADKYIIDYDDKLDDKDWEEVLPILKKHKETNNVKN